MTDFNLGEIPPEVTIRHIGDPFEEFYEDENNLGAMNEANNDSKDEHLKNHGDGINNGSGYNSQNLDDEDEDDEDDDEDDEDDEEEDEDDYDDHDLGTINEGISLLNFNENSTTPSANSFAGLAAPPLPPPLNPSRDSFHSILHPYGVNSIIGPQVLGRKHLQIY